jgi:hypothetical protein
MRRRDDLARIRMAVGETGLGERLGRYYLDLRPVIPVVESGYHGPLDEQGVPLTRVGPGRPVYSTVTIAQYALALHDASMDLTDTGLQQRLLIQLEAIRAHVEADGAWRGFSVHRWDNAKYGSLRAPWVSALSQGNGISALLRGFQRSGDKGQLQTAESMFAAMERDLRDGGVRTSDRCGHLWFEEYPSDPPLHVLNGFVFALFGVLDFARATGERKGWQWWEAGIETLKAHLADFDCGYWSAYDLRYRELTSLHYQLNIHVPQLEAMHALTGLDIFRRYAERWRQQVHAPWSRARWWLGLRWQAFRRGRRFE